MRMRCYDDTQASMRMFRELFDARRHTTPPPFLLSHFTRHRRYVGHQERCQTRDSRTRTRESESGTRIRHTARRTVERRMSKAQAGAINLKCIRQTFQKIYSLPSLPRECHRAGSCVHRPLTPSEQQQHHVVFMLHPPS